jgi:5-methylcytosine-specific restriction protein A
LPTDICPVNSRFRADEFSGGENAAAGWLRELGFTIRGPHEQLFDPPSYEPGSVYNRVQDIHDIYGGQRQGGISTPKAAPLIFLFTGESGGQFGSEDGPRDDGIFVYTGEGQVGDMEFVRGNLTIRDHVQHGRDLLLFEKLRRVGFYRFLGNYACDGWELKQAPDRNGTQRQVIAFHLRSAVSADEREVEHEVDELGRLPLEELRRRAIEDADEQPQRQEGHRTYIQMSASVRAYVLRRASGICESCDQPAPFVRESGEPYLEPHHTRRLADGGPDHPHWVGAICPACHREIHHGKYGQKRNDELQAKLQTKEAHAEERSVLPDELEVMK